MLDTLSAVVIDYVRAEALSAILIHLRRCFECSFLDAYIFLDDSKCITDTLKWSGRTHLTQWQQL